MQEEFSRQVKVMAAFLAQRSERFLRQVETNHARERNPVLLDDSADLSSDTKEYSLANDVVQQELIPRKLERVACEAGALQEMFPWVHSIQVAFPDRPRR
ncbi:hypothetical protein LBMAG51_00410 [Phycisphaerae bacterium]|nr:hypothetical protein LBMAG51_00410 [Phycisphaerae bacterium]